MIDRPVVLVGFMAAGKSTVGRRLAGVLGVPFVDTDAKIIAAYGPISDIFVRDGEARFRVLEHEAVLAALAGPLSVISLGGGALTHDATHAILQNRTIRVYLDVPASVLVSRLGRSKTPRPAAGPAPSLEHVAGLLAAREPRYREAEIVVDAQRRSIGGITAEIVDQLRYREAPPEASPGMLASHENASYRA